VDSHPDPPAAEGFDLGVVGARAGEDLAPQDHAGQDPTFVPDHDAEVGGGSPVGQVDVDLAVADRGAPDALERGCRERPGRRRTRSSC